MGRLRQFQACTHNRTPSTVSLVARLSHTCIYALLPDKREATYRRVIAGLLHARPDLQPQSVLVDYERAAVNALQNAFPQTNVKGCFFHLSQNIYRKVQSNGLQEQYASDVEVNLHMYTYDHSPSICQRG